jgi:radical SAM protein with 4Fe4S-binding SPASM domain
MIKFSKFPKAIEIQTTSYCNAQCIACPHKTVSKNLNMGNMNNDLFIKILNEINNKEILFIPYLNGEPFLDPLFFQRLDLIKKKCPNARIEISTNLSQLSKEKIKKLSNYKIAELRLSVFGFNKDLHKKMMPGLDWYNVKKNLDFLVGNKKIRKNIEKIGLVMLEFPGIKEEEFNLARDFCKKHDIEFNLWGFLDRAGNVDKYSNKINNKKVKGCSQNRPIERLHVDFEGNVILCCQDWKREYILGNVNDASILEIWNSKKFNKIREDISGKGNTPELCRKCLLAEK